MLQHIGIPGALTVLLALARPAAPVPEEQTVTQALAESMRGPFDALALKRDLRALGDEALPALLAALAPSNEAASLDRKHALVVERLLADWERPALRAFLRTQVDAGASVARREAALGILERSGDGRDIELLFRLAPAARAASPVERPVRAAFGRALEAILERDPESTEWLARWVHEGDPSLLPVAAEVVGARPDGERCLAAWLGREPRADAVLLRALHGIAGQRSLRLTASGRERVRALLRPFHEPSLLGLAAAVAADARDADAIEDLIDLLGHVEPTTRTAALAALRSITGQGFRADPDLWSSWHRDELSWWATEATAVLADAGSRDPARAARALQALSTRRLFEDRRIDALLPALEHREPQIVRLACGVLAQIPSPRTGSALAACLDHTDASVRAMAHSSLQRLTGHQLPPDRLLWDRALTTEARHE